MSEPRWKLPEIWVWATASDIANIVGGGTPPTSDESNFAENEIPWITPADLTGYKEVYIGKGRRDLSLKGLSTSGATLVPKGTVLFSSRAPIGYCAIASQNLATNQGFKSLVLFDDIKPEFVRYYLLASAGYAESLASGTTFKELSGARASQLAIPIAPIPEQGRIVAKLDKLTARVRAADAELERIPELIRHYRESIIQHLLKECSEEALLEDLIEEGPSNGLYLPKTAYGDGTPILRIENYDFHEAEPLSKWKRVALPPEMVGRYDLKPADIVVNRVNSPSHLGKSLLVTEHHVPAVFESNMMRFRVNKRALPEYVQLVLGCNYGRALLTAKAKWAVNQASINQSDVRGTIIPLPNIEQQSRIIKKVRAADLRIRSMSKDVQLASQILGRLEQAFAEKAFRGELVAQDPTDEPVEALFTRIRACQGASPKLRRGRRAA